LASPKQLGEVLFDNQKLGSKRKQKQGNTQQAREKLYLAPENQL
jgi:DNA polymerase I-like protein with 3'-5' exonuclease and polymerase domains